MLSKSKSERLTSAVAHGGTKLLSKAASARKFGKNVILSRSRHEDDDNDDEDDAIFSSSMDEGEDSSDFRWSIRPGSHKNIKPPPGDSYSSEDEDLDGEDHTESSNERSSEMSSLEMAIGGPSAHSKQSLGLGTISEDDDDDDGFATEHVDLKKKKKKKKGADRSPKRNRDLSPKRDRSPKREVSPKRKLNRTQSDRSSGKIISSSDHGPKRGGLSRSKSSQSDRQVGTLEGSHSDDNLKVPSRTIKKAKSKKLKKGRSKSPMKVDFTGRVAEAATDYPTEENDSIDGDTKPSPAKTAANNEGSDSDSDSYVDPITKANMIAAHLMRSTSQEYRNRLAEIEEKKPMDFKNEGKLEALLTSGTNTHVLGDEDSFFSRNSAARGSGQGHARNSTSSRGSGSSFSNKLRTSLTHSFGDEWHSSNVDDTERRSVSLDAEKDRVAQLLDDLEKYEQELSQGHAAAELEKEALEFELHKQTEKNQELEVMIEEMKSKIEEMESALKNQGDDQMLLVENQILKQRLEQKESAMLSMSSMHSLNNRSYSNDLPLVEEDDLNTFMSTGTADSDDEGHEKPSAKLQGNLLQVRAKLAEKDRTIERQAQEIKSLQRECEDYKDDEAREKMKSYIEGLEKEKKFFIAEIAKLKEANEKAAMNSSSHISVSAFNRQSISISEMTSVTEASSQYGHSTVGDEMSKEDDSFALWGSSQNFNRRGSTATQQTPNRRQSASGWRSFSTRLFGGLDEVNDTRPVAQSEADKMLDDLTKDM